MALTGRGPALTSRSSLGEGQDRPRQQQKQPRWGVEEEQGKVSLRNHG
jgi:hypothetical protein